MIRLPRWSWRGDWPSHARWLLSGFALLVSLPLFAYYPFLHLRPVENQWIAAPERFDLREQPGGAVPVVVTRGTELALEEGDAWESVVSEVKLATEQWSQVPRSALRLRYAGELSIESTADTPHVQVLFDELAPGVLAMGGPVESGEWREDASGPFKPITKSMVILSADLQGRPSYSEAFFLTLVHEMGHALGLQHTFTSSVMSTGVTRATTKAVPLATDDHAGIASLYPGTYFREETGVLRGRVVLGEEGLHFASVIALAATGEAVSTLTLPDGSYEIQGIPPGDYYVYAQAVPESSDPALGPGQIVLPQNDDGQTYAPGQHFATRFFPDAIALTEASVVSIPASGLVEGIDIAVQPASPSSFRGATTYSFPGDFAVNPAQINRNGTRHFLLADGNGLTIDGQKTGGLEVSVFNTPLDQDALLPYPWAPDFLQINVEPNAFETNGPKTVLWTVDGSTYVQPAAFVLLDKQPPSLESVMEMAGNRPDELNLTLRGEGLDGSERYLAEGLPITAIRLPTTVDTETGDPDAIPTELRLPTPYTSDGRPVRLVVLGNDGQSSLHLDANGKRVASRVSPRGNLRLSRTSVAAGTESLVYLESDGPLFAGVRIGLDFGSPSIVATRVWKLNDALIAANVAVSPTAEIAAYEITIHNDLALIPGGQALDVIPGSSVSLLRSESFRDAITGDVVLYPGSIAEFRPVGEHRPTLIPMLLGDRKIEAIYDEERELYAFQIPGDFPLGLTEIAAGGNSVGIEIAAPPPVIREATSEGRTNRLEEGANVTLTIRFLLELPEEVAVGGGPTTVRVLIGGRVGQQVEVEQHEESDRLYDVSAETPLANVKVEDGMVSFQIEWGGRLSAPHRLPLSRRGAATLR